MNGWLAMLMRLGKMLSWLKSFNVESFVDEMEKEYINAQENNDYGPAICAYYSHMGDLITQFYGKYWHFSPWSHDGSTLHPLFEKELGEPNTTVHVLELGCGFGHTVEWMNNYTMLKVEGITLSPDEVTYAKNKGLTVYKGNYHDLDSVPEISNKQYDAIYALYCLKYSNNLPIIFSEAFKYLKPGGRFLSYEILTTDKFNIGDRRHLEIRKNICRSTNMPPLHGINDMLNAAEKAGFQLVTSEELSVGNATWYNSNFVNLKLYCILKSSIISNIIWVLERIKILSKGSYIFYARHIVHPPVDFVEGGRMGIITGSNVMVFKKPH